MMSTLFSKEFTADDWGKVQDGLYTLSTPSSESGLTGEFAAWVLVLSAGEYIYADGIFGDIKFKYTVLETGCLLVSTAPFAGKIVLTEGKSYVNPGNSYSVDYTGDEINVALGRLLCDQYGAEPEPGCHVIGKDSYNPINLNTVRIPGMYTAFFYNHGPSVLNIYNGTSPIRMHVYSDEDYNTGKKATWQTIEALIYDDGDETTGQEKSEQLYLFFRDIENCDAEDETADYGWARMKLSTGSTVVINNLKSENPHVALSANMGRYLKYLIDNDDQGSSNLLINSDYVNGDTGWIFSEDAEILIFEGTNQIENMFGRNSNGVVVSTKSDEYRGVAVDAAFMPAINGTEDYITASVYVMSPNKATVFAQLQLCDIDGNAINEHISTYDNEFETDSEGDQPITSTFNSYITVTSVAGSELSRIVITLPKIKLFAAQYPVKKISFYFGVTGGGDARFYHPQLEHGRHATSWHMNWYDMWYEFDNARFLNEIPIDRDITIDTIHNQQTLVFSEAEKQFIARYIATGGGGGFVAQDEPPEHTEVLWYCTKNNSAMGYYINNFYAYMNGSWKQLSYKVLESTTPPDDKTVLWINTSPTTSYTNCRPYSKTEPPDLMYYDTNDSKWRPVGAARRPGFIIQREVPNEADSDLMWIHPDTWIARVYYKNKWYPIQAVWGANNI